MFIAQTPRLILRRFRADDAAAMQRVFGDAEVMRFGSGAKSPQWVCAWLDECAQNFERRGYGQFAVVLRDADEVIGFCGLNYYADVDGRAEVEVGYRLARAWWGRGYATEAAAAVRDYAFATLRLPRLIALIDPDNAASIRVAEKIGMWYEKDVMLEAYDHPDRLYAMSRAGEFKHAPAGREDRS